MIWCYRKSLARPAPCSLASPRAGERCHEVTERGRGLGASVVTPLRRFAPALPSPKGRGEPSLRRFAPALPSPKGGGEPSLRRCAPVLPSLKRGGEPRIRMLSPLKYCPIYCFTNSVKFMIYFPIAETQHF